MRALNIDLDGYVTFRNLERGETTIDGSCIKTGTIDADEIGSRISRVSDYVIIDGGDTTAINGIATMQSGKSSGYLDLIASHGIILNSDTIVNKFHEEIATQKWVKEFVYEKLEDMKKIINFFNNK
nr:hypothetical protein [Clostridium novyi]